MLSQEWYDTKTSGGKRMTTTCTYLRIVTQWEPEECSLELLLEREAEHADKGSERVRVLGDETPTLAWRELDSLARLTGARCVATDIPVSGCCGGSDDGDGGGGCVMSVRGFV